MEQKSTKEKLPIDLSKSTRPKKLEFSNYSPLRRKLFSSVKKVCFKHKIFSLNLSSQKSTTQMTTR